MKAEAQGEGTIVVTRQWTCKCGERLSVKYQTTSSLAGSKSLLKHCERDDGIEIFGALIGEITNENGRLH